MADPFDDVTDEQVDTLVARQQLSPENAERIKKRRNIPPVITPAEVDAVAEEPQEEQPVAPSLAAHEIEPLDPSQYVGPEPATTEQGLEKQIGQIEGLEQQRDTLIQQKKEAVQGVYDVAKQQAEEEKAARLAGLETEAEYNESIAKAQARKEEFAKAEERKLNDMMTEFGEMKVDPSKFWRDRSTGQKIIAGISLALGAVGGGLTRTGENKAVGVITDAIDRDIAAQKDNIEVKGEAIEKQEGLYAKALQRFDDSITAEKAAKIAALDQVKNRLLTIKGKYQSPTLQAKADQALNEIDLAQNAEKLKFEQLIQAKAAEQATKGMRFKPGSVVSAEDLGKMDKETRGSFVPLGGDRFAVTAIKPSPAQRDAIVALDSSVEGIKKLSDFAGKDWAKLNPNERGKIESLRNALMGSLRLPILGPGVMTEQEVERLKKTIPDPKSFLTWASREKGKAEVLIDHFADQRSKQLNALGVPMEVAKDEFSSFTPEQ